jgi:hypothetical protein
MERVTPSLSPSKLSHRKGLGEKYGKAYSQAYFPYESPSPNPPHGERQGLERLPSLSTWRQKEAMENENEPTLASFSNQLTKAKKSFLLDY